MRKYISIPVLLLLSLCALPALGQTIPAEEEVEDNVYERKDIDTTLYFYDRSMPADSINAWRNNKAFAYIKDLDSLLKKQQAKKMASSPEAGKNKKKQSSSSSSSSSASEYTTPPGGSNSFSGFLNSSGASVILWILAAAFVLFVLYKLFLAKSILQRRQAKDEKADVPQVEEEVITAESDFDRMIRQAVAAGNYRLAVRYQYLKTLHLLASRNLVEMAADKTNYQYVQEIKNHQLRNELASLSLNYDYVWYGEFEVEQGVYHKLEAAFKDFNQKV